MKNFMVANMRKNNKRYDFKKIEVLLMAQIENIRELGWHPKDIILLANFDYKFMDVESINVDLNKFCWTGSKMFGLKYIFDNEMINKDEVIYSHDLDAWQNCHFDCPDIDGDIGVATYSNSKYNGGSIFWKYESKDIIDEIIKRLLDGEEVREEPTLNRVFKSKEYKDRVTVVNNGFNVGCSGFTKRYERSMKPIKVCHFHPYNKLAWETFALDRNGLEEIAITIRLEKLLRKYYEGLR